MLGINARVEDLKRELVQSINRAEMPACLLDYVLTEILNEVRLQRMGEVQKERQLHREELTKQEEQVKASLQEVDNGTA